MGSWKNSGRIIVACLKVIVACDSSGSSALYIQNDGFGKERAQGARNMDDNPGEPGNDLSYIHTICMFAIHECVLHDDLNFYGAFLKWGAVTRIGIPI